MNTFGLLSLSLSLFLPLRRMRKSVDLGSSVELRICQLPDSAHTKHINRAIHNNRKTRNYLLTEMKIGEYVP
jgi:hypothetical protein